MPPAPLAQGVLLADHRITVVARYVVPAGGVCSRLIRMVIMSTASARSATALNLRPGLLRQIAR